MAGDRFELTWTFAPAPAPSRKSTSVYLPALRGSVLKRALRGKPCLNESVRQQCREVMRATNAIELFAYTKRRLQL